MPTVGVDTSALILDMNKGTSDSGEIGKEYTHGDTAMNHLENMLVKLYESLSSIPCGCENK